MLKPLPTEAAESLCRSVDVYEIKNAMFCIGNDKASRPDGYNACFFKTAWTVVGSNVIVAVKECFDSSFLHSGFNSTSLILVPKKKCPQYIVNFRLIACCQVFTNASPRSWPIE